MNWARTTTKTLKPIRVLQNHAVVVGSRILQRRPISQVVQIPLIFGGLLVALWTWKSLMLIVFQDKIIYMPYLGRQEQLEHHPTPAVEWSRHALRTSDHVTIVLCNAKLTKAKRDQSVRGNAECSDDCRKRVTMVYLQGNASSTPPRLPHLSKFLTHSQRALPDTDIDLWTVSYRGYWESTGRPSEAGLLQDVRDSLTYILKPLIEPTEAVNPEKVAQDSEPQDEVILWGHSIGASLAIQSLHHVFGILDDRGPDRPVKVILETPFDSIRSVLLALYPEPWLPYRYLSPFLRTRLDMGHALTRLSREARSVPRVRDLQVLLAIAEKDEIVPPGVSRGVVSVLEQNGVRRVVTRVVRGGLHQDCLMKPEMHRFVTEFMRD
ncbi:putative Alpha/beta superfamily hydrolase [Taphrina deformans PYCC 5710]|uniref:Alpha/beta superfamily hydrolase n=1 Tax=Taphrina deformans (strain PYCC 5710 / ATCC 11124 / CBS 356.35 / IMI 108563 / JCM 9778 / NBRC 8474) TaxID=1097556 RepID=R4XAR1_TAPDE|nr:putative Alpha/beta superfamily hydrolase [Taphrina deformans PYCC 5710]|eukprot:CCG82903.1 putative Alpha/beta superfamily hydrolase [Taphrina deformans PYCC 5710]